MLVPDHADLNDPGNQGQWEEDEDQSIEGPHGEGRGQHHQDQGQAVAAIPRRPYSSHSTE